MNDGTNIASDDIILKPKFRYWLMKNFLLITLAIFVFIFSKYIREHELLKFISGTILVLLIFIIFYRYISMLLCTKWIITREQIKIYQGVLSKRINYIELYRVYDYEEKQSFIQSLINNTNIYIYSGDKSTPELLMNGLKANSDIIHSLIFEKSRRPLFIRNFISYKDSSSFSFFIFDSKNKKPFFCNCSTCHITLSK